MLRVHRHAQVVIWFPSSKNRVFLATKGISKDLLFRSLLNRNLQLKAEIYEPVPERADCPPFLTEVDTCEDLEIFPGVF